jgi:hypothetical protein
MLDYQLQAIIQNTLVAGLAARGVTANVLQNNQPRQFVIPSTPTVFHTLGPRHKYGWPSRVDTRNSETGAFDTTTTQVVHTRFQIAGLIPNSSPANSTQLSSGDLASIASDIMQHETAIAAFVAQDCNVFRVSDNPTLPFQDSSDQTVWWASFDIIFTHKDVFTTSTGALSDFNPNFERI